MCQAQILSFKAWGALAAGMALAVCAIGLAACSRTPRPNVILITVDGLQADGRGGVVGDTPTIDALAARGATYSRVIAASLYRNSAVASLLTGLNPRRHEARTNEAVLADSAETLGQLLSAEGYDCVAFLEDARLEPLRRGARALEGDVSPSGLSRWVRSVEKPFHLWWHVGAATPADLDSAELASAAARAAELRLAEILVALRGSGRLDDTLVVLTAPRGPVGVDTELPHGIFRDEVLHVPWIFIGPGVPVGQVAAQVGGVDVLPTVLELIDVPRPRGLVGHSAAAALFGHRIKDRIRFTEGFSEGAGTPGYWAYIPSCWNPERDPWLYLEGDEPAVMRALSAPRGLKVIHDPFDPAEQFTVLAGDAERDPDVQRAQTLLRAVVSLNRWGELPETLSHAQIAELDALGYQ